MVLVDSSVWIHYFNGKITWQTEILDQMLQQAPICIGDLILTEVLQGFRTDREYTKAKKILSILPCKELGGFDMAIQSADNYRKLRKKGGSVHNSVSSF